MVVSLYGIENENKTIMVYIEEERGEIANVSLEILGKGRELADQIGWTLSSVIVGTDIDQHSDTLIEFGADEVVLVNHGLLENFTVEAYSHVVFQVLNSYRPSIFLLGATANGRDIAGRLAVRLRTGLNADCTNLRIDPSRGILVCEVSGFGSGVLALIEAPKHRPQMATIRPGVFPITNRPSRGAGKIIQFDAELKPENIKTRIVKQVIGEGIDLTRASVLVAGGRGIAGDFSTLAELAEILGGEVGATRPPVDDGFIERERQVGQTGVVCSPKFAICCGISGAFHFIVGIEKSEKVISINSDPDAPIFDYSDYYVIEDVENIVPALIRALKKEKELAYG
jgi:electron transfer flavoprotein alpha subunit